MAVINMFMFSTMNFFLKNELINKWKVFFQDTSLVNHELIFTRDVQFANYKFLRYNRQVNKTTYMHKMAKALVS